LKGSERDKFVYIPFTILKTNFVVLLWSTQQDSERAKKRKEKGKKKKKEKKKKNIFSFAGCSY
jgi:uncharacterized membrane protein